MKGQSEAFFGAISGGVGGLLIAALLFGFVYLVIEIAEHAKATSETATKAFDQSANFQSMVERRLASIEDHVARMDGMQVSDQAAKSVATAITGTDTRP